LPESGPPGIPSAFAGFESSPAGAGTPRSTVQNRIGAASVASQWQSAAIGEGQIRSQADGTQEDDKFQNLFTKPIVAARKTNARGESNGLEPTASARQWRSRINLITMFSILLRPLQAILIGW
jgi:hypothetical protein